MEPIGQHHLSWIPSGKLTLLLNMVVYSWCTHKTRWFCMAMIMLSFQRVNHGKSLQPPSSPICDPHLSPGCASCTIRCACQLRVHKRNMEMSWCHRPKVDFARKVLVWNKLSTILVDLQEPLLSLLILFLYIFITMILFPGWLDWVVGLMDWWTDGLTEVNKDLHKAQHSCNYFELDLQYAAARSLVSMEGWIMNLCV